MTAAADLGPFPGTSPRALSRSQLRVGVAPVARRRPALELVAPARSDAPRAPFVAVVLSLLAGGLLGLLVLNTVLAQDAFALHTLTQQGRTLADEEQSLAREVEGLRAPQALAAAATDLGMVQAGPPAFLRLPDGAILGAALPALAPGETRTADGEVVPAPDAAPVEEPSASSDDEPADETTSTDEQAPAEDDR